LNTLTQSVLSTVSNLFQVIPSGTYDPTSDIVQIAITPETYPPTDPTLGIWATGSWQAFPGIVPGPTYWAVALIGPANGGIALAIGSYHVWVKVIDSPEVPVFLHSILEITQ